MDVSASTPRVHHVMSSTLYLAPTPPRVLDADWCLQHDTVVIPTQPNPQNPPKKTSSGAQTSGAMAVSANRREITWDLGTRWKSREVWQPSKFSSFSSSFFLSGLIALSGLCGL